MAAIKLSRLPDRTPVRMAVHLPPGLADRLAGYAFYCASCYGVEEPLSELIPAMLEAFLPRTCGGIIPGAKGSTWLPMPTDFFGPRS